MFEKSAINVVISRVAINEAIEEKRVKREAPVLGRRSVVVTLPLAGVVERVDGLLICVQIIVDITVIVTKGSVPREADGKNEGE